jgi:hypothetical protein
MYLIDDVDFVSSLIGFKSSLFDEVSDIFYSVVRCSIDLDTIEHISRIKSHAMSTLVTWIAILEIETIDSLRHDTSRGSFARSTRTREDIGVSDLVLDKRIP